MNFVFETLYLHGSSIRRSW